MKGLKHKVIEINDTHSESIDRILVFLKPTAKEIAVAASRAEATSRLEKFDVGGCIFGMTSGELIDLVNEVFKAE